MEGIGDEELLRLVLDQLGGPGYLEKELGPHNAEIQGLKLILRYEGTGTRTGKFKTVVDIPESVGDEVWNLYVEESHEIDYWIYWAVIVPVNEAYCTGNLYRPADPDGCINMPLC